MTPDQQQLANKPPKPISGTKRMIMAKAADLFAEKGFSAVGTTEVGEVVGLGKGALYYHIGSKGDLLYVIMTDYMATLIESGRAIIEDVTDTRTRIERLSRSFMETMFSNRSAMTVCFREIHSLNIDLQENVVQLHGDYQEIWEKTFEEGARRGECRSVNRIECKALLGMYFYSFLWVKTNGSATGEEISDNFAGIVLDAVGIGR